MNCAALHTVACVCFLLTSASLPGGVTTICSRSLPVNGSAVVQIARAIVSSSTLNYVLKTTLTLLQAFSSKFADSYSSWLSVFLGHWSHEEKSRYVLTIRLSFTKQSVQ